MDIEKQIVLINKELRNSNLSLSKIFKKLNINKNIFEREIKNTNYVYSIDEREYYKKNDLFNLKNTESNITSNTTKSNVLNLSKEDMNILKTLIDNSNDILKTIRKEKINITNSNTIVTSIRINEEIFKMTKEYASKNNKTIGSIINQSLLDYLESNNKK